MQKIIDLLPIAAELDDDARAELEEEAARSSSLTPAVALAVDLCRQRSLIADDARLSTLVPGLDRLEGTVSAARFPSLVRPTLDRHAQGSSWIELGSMSVGDLLAWPAVGENKARAIIVGCVMTTASAARGGGVRLTAEGPVEALRAFAAWARFKFDVDNLLDAIAALSAGGVPQLPDSVREALEAADIERFAGEERLARWRDPAHVAQQLLARVDERSRSILFQRSLDPVRRRRPTLRALGETFGVTHERVRQLEEKAMARLASALHEPQSIALRHAAADLATSLGACFPLEDLEGSLARGVDGSGDRREAENGRLLLYAAGPYRVEDVFLVSDSVSGFPGELVGAVEEAMDDGIAGIDAATDALVSLGVRPEVGARLLRALPRIRVLGETVLSWSGTLADKANTILLLTGRPMSAEEISDLIPEGHAISTLRNYLSDDPRFRRTGKNAFGLSVWEGEEYVGVADSIRLELEGGPRSVASLRQELSERFGFSPNSVTIMCGTSHLFVMEEDGMVRLRREDEPYIPEGSLEGTSGCFVVDGAWAFAITVDRDVLRGSGRWIPETFAVHLGLQPGRRGAVRLGERTVALGWRAQNPWIGSIRTSVEEVGGKEGDRLFIRRATADELDLRLVRRTDLEAASGADRLLLMVGADLAQDDHLRAVGTALGLGGAVRPDAAHVMGRLRGRGEHGLADLLGEALAATGQEAASASGDGSAPVAR